MKVIVNKPTPVFAPPTTYDLVGLTLAQVQFIRRAAGDTSNAVNPGSLDICETLMKAGIDRR